MMKMPSWLPGLSHRAGYAAFLSTASYFAGLVPPSTHPVTASVQTLLTWFDIPISAAGLLLPAAWRGAWLFFVPPGTSRSLFPDETDRLLKQLLIGVPLYVALFYLPPLLARAFGGKKGRRPAKK